MDAVSLAEIDSLPVMTGPIIISTKSIIPVVIDLITNAALAVASFASTIASVLVQFSIKFQSMGETLLAAFFVLSFLQAAVAMYQYRYDVRGQLIFPDGPTVGVEDASVSNTCNELNAPETMKIAVNGNGCMHNASKEIRAEVPKDIYGVPYFLRKLNKSLLLLLPWITNNIHIILTKNSHLFHIGFIITLVKFLEDTMLGKDDGDYSKISSTKLSSQTQTALPTLLDKLARQNQLEKDPIRLLVIGDSLAVGIGCLEEFDEAKDNSWPMALVENTSTFSTKDEKCTKLQSPVFPQILAKALSFEFKQPVHWRSGGVDGGDVNDIRKFCMDIIRQECAAHGEQSFKIGSPYKSGPPDIIVVLFGMNDLKNLVSLNIIPQIFRGKDEKGGGGGIAHHFRHGMEALIDDIRSFAPNAYIVFPQLPIQTFHKNSIVNILPLGVFVDTMMGFWEGQKRRVTEGRASRERRKIAISPRNTMYIDLDAKEIADWYTPDNGWVENCDGVNDDILISADGVHPNKRMYAKWSESVGKKLYQRIKPQLEQMKRKHHLVKT